MKYRHWQNPLVTEAPKPLGFLARERYSDLTLDEFRRKYEEPNLPLVFTGAASTWPANTLWTREARHECPRPCPCLCPRSLYHIPASVESHCTWLRMNTFAFRPA